MEFFVTILTNGKPYKMLVKRIYQGEAIERFEVSAGGRSVVLRSNINIPKEKRQNNGKIEWKVEQGEVKNVEAFVSVIREIEHHFHPVNNLPAFKKQKLHENDRLV